MKLPSLLHPLLLSARHWAARAQRTLAPHPRRANSQRLLVEQRLFDVPLPQPDPTSCGSSVIAVIETLRDPAKQEQLLTSADPAALFGDWALSVRRATNAPRNQGQLQLPWPAVLGTRPAALIRHLGKGYRNRVVDPYGPDAAYDAIVAAGEPVPLYIGEGSWMQHIVLVLQANPDWCIVYEPACGQVLRRTRADFVTAHLELAGWQQPWLVVLPG